MPDSKSTPAISQAVTSASGLVSEPRPKKMLDQVPDAIRRKHYCPRTEESHATGSSASSVASFDFANRILLWDSTRKLRPNARFTCASRRLQAQLELAAT